MSVCSFPSHTILIFLPCFLFLFLFLVLPLSSPQQQPQTFIPQEKASRQSRTDRDIDLQRLISDIHHRLKWLARLERGRPFGAQFFFPFFFPPPWAESSSLCSYLLLSSRILGYCSKDKLNVHGV